MAQMLRPSMAVARVLSQSPAVAERLQLPAGLPASRGRDRV